MTETAPVLIPPLDLAGELMLPDGQHSIVIFAHGSGSSRHSPRNRQVAQALVKAGFGVLLFDLLTEPEAVRANIFDIDLLAGRLISAIDWIRSQPRYRGDRVALFGASTGAAAALKAAAARPEAVTSIVSRGGRPDLAGDALPLVTAPTLLIVGGNDEPVLTLNRKAMLQLGGQARLRVIPKATHLFEEPGALDMVIRYAIDWFATH
jgi:pimeloyl-ACP methyl ester carboxylesterase